MTLPLWRAVTCKCAGHCTGARIATKRRTPHAGYCALLSTLVSSAAVADPLVLAPGAGVMLSCQTRAVVLLPHAAGSSGEVRVRLELREPVADRKGTWSVEDVGRAHTSSFAVRDKERCAPGCEMTAPSTGRIELWSPKRVAAEALPAGEALVVIAIDPESLKLNATTVLGKDIAAFEQGTCEKR